MTRDIDLTIVLHRSRSGNWRATYDEGAKLTAVFGETAEDAVRGLMRFLNG